jgi:DNA-binding NarL/FixJ family response regulator
LPGGLGCTDAAATEIVYKKYYLNMKITVGIADDQLLFLRSLGTLINTFLQFEVIVDGLNGEDLIKKMKSQRIEPDILLIDVNMPVMDGPETAVIIAEKFPSVKMVALSMKDDDTTIINMIKAGCCAYLLKDIHPDELEKALLEVYKKGYYNADASNINYRRLIIHSEKKDVMDLTSREKEFLQLACSDLTYRQVALQMHLAERTIDGYRESLFSKLNVQSRVGMALEAVRQKLISL